MTQTIRFDSMPNVDKAAVFQNLCGQVGKKEAAAKIRQLRRQQQLDAQVQPIEEIDLTEELSERESAARHLEFIADELGTDQSDLVEKLRDGAAALRGDMNPRQAAKVLIDLLYEPLVPQEFKGKEPQGVIRVVIGLANKATDEFREALKSAPDLAEELFNQLRYELHNLRFKNAGEIVRMLKEPGEGGIVLIKTLERLITEQGSQVNDFLNSDLDLAKEVGSAQQGSRATEMIDQLFLRAKGEISRINEIQEAAKRRMKANPMTGFTGRVTGKTEREHAKHGGHLERKEAHREDNRMKRKGPAQMVKGGNNPRK